MRHPLRMLAFAAALLAAGAGSARACAFHTYAPAPTVIDRIVAARDLVLARPNTRNPFLYEVTDVLRGSAQDALPMRIDTGAPFDPSTSVLFARVPDDDWREVAVIDAALRPVLEQAQTWGEDDKEARFEVFAALLDHPDPALRTLALQEVDKVPYALLQSLDGQVPDAGLLAQNLWTRSGYATQPIRVLLLGLDGSDIARAEIMGYLGEVSDDPQIGYLGAFATALVELDGVDGVAWLERRFFSRPDQPLGPVEQVVEAMAIHAGLGSEALRARIGAAFDMLLNSQPAAAAGIARQFSSRSDWSQAERLDRVVADGKVKSSADFLPIAVYLAQAREGKLGSKG
ncbi:MAG: hypothetical protein AAGF79_11780 [Pseudomonadota bacterium]